MEHVVEGGICKTCDEREENFITGMCPIISKKEVEQFRNITENDLK